MGGNETNTSSRLLGYLCLFKAVCLHHSSSLAEVPQGCMVNGLTSCTIHQTMLRVALPVKMSCVASYCVSEIFHTESCLIGYLPLHRYSLVRALLLCVCVCSYKLNITSTLFWQHSMVHDEALQSFQEVPCRPCLTH